MIGFLRGSVLFHDDKKFVLFTKGGIGYEIFAPLSVLGGLQKEKEAEVWIYTKVSENEISLYGFSDLGQKQFFEKLIGISGIGPKIALQILSQPVDAFLEAVNRGDDVFVAQTPGIGKKMAQKIIVELQGKIDLTSQESVNANTEVSEAVQALEGLGYDKASILQSLKDAPEDLETEALVKYFLKSKV